VRTKGGQDSRDEPDDDDDEDSSTEQTRKKRSSWRNRNQRTKPSDRYSSLIGNNSDDDWSSNEENQNNMTEDDYKKYIEDVLYNKEKKKSKSRTSSRFGSAGRSIVQPLSSIVRNKHAITHRFKRAKDSYIKTWLSKHSTPRSGIPESHNSILPSSVCVSEQSELLTIVEPSD